MWHSIPAKIRRFVLWHRRWLAAVAAALCVLAVTSALSPTLPGGTPVVIAAKAIPAGAQLTAQDVTTKAVPPGLVPAESLSGTEEVVGRTAVVTLPAGTLIGSSFLLETTPLSPGMRFVPVRVPDADIGRLLRTGDRVSVVAPDAGGNSTIIAAGLRVAAIPQQDTSGPIQARDQNTLVVLEVPDALAAEVSTASLHRGLSLVLG